MKKIAIVIMTIVMACIFPAHTIASEIEGEIESIQMQILSYDELINAVFSLLNDREVISVLQDPDIQKLLIDGNMEALLKNKKIRNLLNDPEMRSVVNKVKERR